MGVPNRLSVAAINIRVHPHEPKIYDDLLRAAFSLKMPIKVFGDQHMLLSSLRSKAEEDVVYGTIAKFTDIDFKQPWYNFETSDAAKDSEVKSVKIPPNLRPNYSAFQFAFHLKKHLFLFECYGDGKQMSPSLVNKFLSELFEMPKIVKKFGVVDLTIEPKEETLSAIFKMATLHHLELMILRPNPDDFQDDEDSVLEELNKQNAGKLTKSYTAIDGKSLRPNEATKKLAQIAARNGRVDAKGKDANGKPIKESTTAHPRIITEYFDPDMMGASVAFKKAVRDFIQNLNPRS